MFRNQNLCLFFGLLVLMAFGATAAMAQPSPTDTSCSGCQLFEDNCRLNCSALDDASEAQRCLMSCARVAAECSCDAEVTLSSEKLVEMGLAGDRFALKSSCNSTTPCAPEFSSCASWSSYTNCGSTFCGIFKFCGDPPFCEEPDLCFGPATRQAQQRFRVCFNGSGHSCTEYQQTSYPVTCGC